MLIRIGYDLQFEIASPLPFVALLSVHPSREADLVDPDGVLVEPPVDVRYYLDSFGNRCARFVAQPGVLRLHCLTTVRDSGEPDLQNQYARETPVSELPDDVLRFLLPSRYCEVDALGAAALDLFGHLPPGGPRVQAVCSWVHDKVRFGYGLSRPTKTALDVFTERTGVCRDFQHLAITFCRALNIPARYATGYLGDIGFPVSPSPMDFSAWFEVYLEDRWWTCDARHNMPRIGRVLMAVGQDASDVAITTTFGTSVLRQFIVITDEITDFEDSAPAEASASASGD